MELNKSIVKIFGNVNSYHFNLIVLDDIIKKGGLKYDFSISKYLVSRVNETTILF